MPNDQDNNDQDNNDQDNNDQDNNDQDTSWGLITVLTFNSVDGMLCWMPQSWQQVDNTYSFTGVLHRSMGLSWPRSELFKSYLRLGVQHPCTLRDPIFTGSGSKMGGYCTQEILALLALHAYYLWGDSFRESIWNFDNSVLSTTVLSYAVDCLICRSVPEWDWFV